MAIYNYLMVFSVLAIILFGAAAVVASSEDAAVKASTAKFHKLSRAIEAGYQQASECVSEPGEGAMGYHYANLDLVEDGEVEAQSPEVLLYIEKGNKMKLAAVEYLVPAPEGPFDEAPEVLGEEMHFMEPHEGLPFPHYELHVWVWKHNPEGKFADFNPKLSC